MKNLFLAAILFMGLTTFAQQGSTTETKARTEQLTPDQRRELRLKELTLKLDLTAAQQKEMAKILADQEASRAATMATRKAEKEKNVQLTSEQKFERKSKRLDQQIAMQQRLKSFLTPLQMEKFEAMKSERKQKARHYGKKGQRKTDAPKRN